MNNDQKFTFAQLIKEIDIFEEKFIKNPADKALLEFFKSFNKIVNEGGYTTEQLQGIRDRILKLREKFSETKESLSKKTNDTLDRHKNFSQYIKTSHINK
jgi:hypothetical protein